MTAEIGSGDRRSGFTARHMRRRLAVAESMTDGDCRTFVRVLAQIHPSLFDSMVRESGRVSHDPRYHMSEDQEG